MLLLRMPLSHQRRYSECNPGYPRAHIHKTTPIFPEPENRNKRPPLQQL